MNKLKLFNCKNVQKFLSENIELTTKILDPKIYIVRINNTDVVIKFLLYRLSHIEYYLGLDKEYMMSTDAEIKIITVLQDIIQKNYTHSIIRLLHTHICDNFTITPNDNCKINNPDYLLCSYQDDIATGKALPKCAFIAMEYCPLDLSVFINKYVDTSFNYYMLKTILFQVIHALYIIKVIHPSFRHNDLHMGNVLLSVKPIVDKITYHKYTVNQKVYYVPYYGITAKICDFGFSTMDGIKTKASEDRATMYYRTNNDMLIILNQIYEKCYMNHILIFNFVRNLLSKIEPNESYNNIDIKRIRKIEHLIPTYEEMLTNGFTAFLKLPENGEITHIFEPL
jgi:serine/threonine protein kinase